MCAKKFTFFESFLEAMEEMPMEMQGDFAIGIIRYGIRDELPEFKEAVQRVGFKLVRPVIDSKKQDNERKKKSDNRDSTDNPEANNGKSMENPQKIHGKSVETSRNRNKEKDKGNNNAQMEFALGATCSDDFSFEDFRTQYPFTETVNGNAPRRVLTDRKKEEAAFKRLSKAEKVAVKVSIPKYHAYLRATGEYQKNALTFLNGRNWEDDYSLPDTQAKADESKRQGDFGGWLAQEDKRRAENG